MDPNIRTIVAELAVKQHGNITRQQLLAVGVGQEAIKHWARAGYLHPVHRGVYGVGRPSRAPLERAAAAVLASGDSAALSHASAMANWGFWKRWESPFEVSATADRRRAGIVVHHSTTLHRRDVRTQQGIRTTSPARTLFDMATRLRDLTRAVNNALHNSIGSVSPATQTSSKKPRRA